jgi:superoxide dismutase, Fe-Mn family
MCQETLELHHGKHHNAYVTALNGLIESKGLAGKSLEQICAEAGKQGADGLPVLNQAGQHWNHMPVLAGDAPGGGGDKLPAALAGQDRQRPRRPREVQGGLQAGRRDAVRLGLGLAGDRRRRQAEGDQDAERRQPALHRRGQPILGCDVWEHAYYLDFRNVRPNYLQNFLDKLVNWEVVADLMAKGGHRRPVA